MDIFGHHQFCLLVVKEDGTCKACSNFNLKLDLVADFKCSGVIIAPAVCQYVHEVMQLVFVALDCAGVQWPYFDLRCVVLKHTRDFC